jgi:hypothetical protein
MLFLIVSIAIFIIGVIVWSIGIVGLLITKFESSIMFELMIWGCVVLNVGNILAQIAWMLYK